jgi:hypothetical protein
LKLQNLSLSGEGRENENLSLSGEGNENENLSLSGEGRENENLLLIQGIRIVNFHIFLSKMSVFCHILNKIEFDRQI